MKNLTMYLPSPRFFVGTLIVLVVTTLALRQFASNPTVAKVKGYLGLAV
jgi:succinate-acetate transporter protein